VVDRAQKQIPLEWLEGDEPAYNVLLNRLMGAAEHVPDLIEDSRRRRDKPISRMEKEMTSVKIFFGAGDTSSARPTAACDTV